MEFPSPKFLRNLSSCFLNRKNQYDFPQRNHSRDRNKSVLRIINDFENRSFQSRTLKKQKNPQHVLRVLYSRWDLNPYGPYSPLDFKSSVSTNSTTRALEFFLERKTGFEPATPTLARWCSTPELLSHFGIGIRRHSSNFDCKYTIYYKIPTNF